MNETLDDRLVVSPVCNRCKHLISQRNHRCAAFQEIPMEIWQGLDEHLDPVEGDRGIHFEEAQDTLRFSVELEQANG